MLSFHFVVVSHETIHVCFSPLLVYNTSKNISKSYQNKVKRLTSHYQDVNLLKIVAVHKCDVSLGSNDFSRHIFHLTSRWLSFTQLKQDSKALTMKLCLGHKAVWWQLPGEEIDQWLAQLSPVSTERWTRCSPAIKYLILCLVFNCFWSASFNIITLTDNRLTSVSFPAFLFSRFPPPPLSLSRPLSSTPLRCEIKLLGFFSKED